MTAATIVQTLAVRGVRLAVEGANLRAFGPLTDDDRTLIREHKPALAALLAGAESAPATAVDADPAGHCPACGSPSWWRATGAGWRCSHCEPRPQPFTGTSLTLAGGQWAPGTVPPADPDDEPAPAVRPADGRVQDCYGAWRTSDQHERIAAYDRHHWTCAVCRRAGRGYASRCAEGERLHELTRAAS